VNLDLVSDVLRAVRLDGAYFYKVVASDPWWVESSSARAELAGVLPQSEHLISYHVVVEGECFGGVPSGPLHPMRGGDVIVFPGGGRQYMGSRREKLTTMTAVVMPQSARLPFEVRMGGGGHSATFVCGFLGCDLRPFNPLIASLPEVLVVHGEERGWLSAFAQHALAEAEHGRAGGELVVTRLAELMFIEVLRRHVESLPADGTGWFAGLRDEVVGRALELLHGFPARDWSLEELARESSCSRSVLAERFARLMGEPPMQYLARWRMQMAARLLTDGTAKVAAIALEVGYDSEAAFSRAFKKVAGVAPAAWRQRRSAPQATLTK
jgi:AraC-like DNA-binding protein